MKPRLAALALAAVALPATGQEPRSPEATLRPPALPAGGRISGIAVNVADLAAAVKFYTEGLGMRVVTTLDLATKSETILTFGTDTSQSSILLIHEKNPAARKAIVQGTALSHLVLGFADIDAVAARLSRLGYSFPPIGTGGQGARVIVMTDPSGVALELIQLAEK